MTHSYHHNLPKKLSLLDSFHLVGHSRSYHKNFSAAYLDGDTSSTQEKKENRLLCRHLRKSRTIFQFNLAISNFSNTDIQNLSHNLTFLRSTTSLNIKLGYNKLINSPTANLLYSSLNYLKALQVLQVKFSSCSTILTETIKQFCNSLQKCSSLQDLTLDFSYCESITEDFLTILFRSLKSLYRLSSLTLIFYYCKELNKNHM